MKDWTSWGIKSRIIKDCNYHAIWNNLKTIRLGEDMATELPPDKAEFYDVGINTMCNAECPFCLPPATKILTSEENKNVENIKIGDLVYSYNETTGNIELKKVSQLFSRVYNGDLIELETEKGIVKMTPNHKVFTQNRGWIEAEKLNTDDIILAF